MFAPNRRNQGTMATFFCSTLWKCKLGSEFPCHNSCRYTLFSHLRVKTACPLWAKVTKTYQMWQKHYKLLGFLHSLHFKMLHSNFQTSQYVYIFLQKFPYGHSHQEGMSTGWQHNKPKWLGQHILQCSDSWVLCSQTVHKEQCSKLILQLSSCLAICKQCFFLVQVSQNGGKSYWRLVHWSTYLHVKSCAVIFD